MKGRTFRGCSHKMRVCISRMLENGFKKAQLRTWGSRDTHSRYDNENNSASSAMLPSTNYMQLATANKSLQRLPRLWGLLIGPLFWNWHWWAALRVKVEILLTWRNVLKTRCSAKDMRHECNSHTCSSIACLRRKTIKVVHWNRKTCSVWTAP